MDTKNGKPDILLSPDEPYAKHRQLFRILTGDYVDVVAWSLAMGKKCKVKTSKVAKVSKTSKKSNEQKIGEDDICRIRPEDTHGAVCGFATTVTMEPYKSSDSSELRPHTVQGTNANHAKLEDSAQLAQVIVLVNELREALVGKGLIKDSA